MLRSVRRGAVPLICGLAASVFVAQYATADPAPAHATTTTHATPTSDYWASASSSSTTTGHRGPRRTSRPIKAKGIDRAELNMPWAQLEPSRGTFDFTEFDQELANAAAAGVKLVPIFWQSGWGGSPAAFETDHEVTSTGATGVALAWWDQTEQNDYITTSPATVAHVTHNPGYGGSFMDYGHLDAQWLDGPGEGGWAPADIVYFQTKWLPATYKTIAAFNAKNSTTFTSFSQVPAALPGAALDGVLPGLPPVERAGHVRPADRGRAQSQQRAALLLLRRARRQRPAAGQPAGHLLQPGQEVPRHGRRGRRQLRGPEPAVRQPGPGLPRPGGPGVDRLRHRRPDPVRGGELAVRLRNDDAVRRR